MKINPVKTVVHWDIESMTAPNTESSQPLSPAACVEFLVTWRAIVRPTEIQHSPRQQDLVYHQKLVAEILPLTTLI
jgi:hypothetical protein